MPAARITPLAPPYEPAVAETLQRIMPPGMEPLKLFRTQAHNLRVMQRMVAGNLLDKGSITLRERELLILRSCACCGCEYEWGVHVALFSERAELSRKVVCATLAGIEQAANAEDNILSPSEVALIKTVDALHEQSAMSDDLWDTLAGHFRPEQILEIVTLIGYYHTISFVANAARVELESYAPRFSDYLATEQ